MTDPSPSSPVDLEAPMHELEAAIARAMTYLDRCQLYGPADAARDALRDVSIAAYRLRAEIARLRAAPSPAVGIEHGNDITAAECLQLIGGLDGCGPANLREVVAAFHERGALLSRLQEDGACARDSYGRLSRAPSQRDTGTLEDLSEWNAGPETKDGKKEVELVSRLRAAIPQPQTKEHDTEDLTRVDSL